MGNINTLNSSLKIINMKTNLELIDLVSVEDIDDHEAIMKCMKENGVCMIKNYITENICEKIRSEWQEKHKW